MKRKRPADWLLHAAEQRRDPVEHPAFRVAREPVADGRRRIVTAQLLRAAPQRVRDAFRRLGKPLSRMTKHDWFAIACEGSAGIIERRFSFGEPKRSAGRPRKFTPQEDEELKALVLACTRDEQGRRVRSDREALRLVLDASFPERVNPTEEKRRREWVRRRSVSLAKRLSLLRKMR